MHPIVLLRLVRSKTPVIRVVLLTHADAIRKTQGQMIFGASIAAIDALFAVAIGQLSPGENPDGLNTAVSRTLTITGHAPKD